MNSTPTFACMEWPLRRTARFVFAGGGKDASTGEPAPFWVKVDATLEGEPSDARVVASRGGGGGAGGGVSRATMRWEALDDDRAVSRRRRRISLPARSSSRPATTRRAGCLRANGRRSSTRLPSEFTVAPTEVPRDAWKIAPAVASSKDDEVEVDVKVAVAADVVADRRRRSFASLDAQVRSIHWSPYDRVGVVNADP